ncbi:substrate-binding periplasmic protein [Allohahella marinimesophila]|uniref:Transporter substrate-binding domain-containing protein n=1 Tax=Allohahella marinimesophila TaxID=1054972 RepID=A0ABP7NI82_9GAMM
MAFASLSSAESADNNAKKSGESSGSADFSRVVRVAINNAPPYRIFDGDQVSGIYVDIFEAMLKQIGWTAEYTEVPFTRALELLKTGDSDVMLGPIRRPYRELFIEYSIPAFPAVDKVFLFTDPAHRIERYEDLKGKLIGVQRGGRYDPRFDKDKQFERFENTRYESLLLMLALNRLDVVIMPESLAIYLINELSVDARISPFVLKGEPAYIAISRKSPLTAYLATLQLTLQRIKDSGEYNRILHRYEKPEIRRSSDGNPDYELGEPKRGRATMQ